MRQQLPLRQVTRIGVYGIAIDQDKILLTEKTTGCYKELLDLPGGGIEFGESLEQALKREFKEETGLGFFSMELVANQSYFRNVTDVADPFQFHHLGLIYRIFATHPIEGAIPEDPFGWYPIKDLAVAQLTPFARFAIENFT